MDWYSRYVLSWELSNSLEAGFCVVALEEALAKATPGIFNTDQGRQFTSEEFTRRLQAAGVQIGMDGRGRVMDNLFVERLWRTVKYEEVYLRDYPDGIAARRRLERYFRFYNTQRRHQGLGGKTPAEVYFNSGSAARRPPWGAGGRRCNHHKPLAYLTPSLVQLMGGSSVTSCETPIQRILNVSLKSHLAYAFGRQRSAHGDEKLYVQTLIDLPHQPRLGERLEQGQLGSPVLHRPNTGRC